MRQIFRTILGTFAPLQNRNLRRYMTGQVISLIGTWMQSTAQAWVVWQLTHSPAALGTTAMLGALPSLLLGPFASAWADRLDRRRVLIFTQVASMLLAIVLAVLVQTHVVVLWHVYLLALLLGAVAALDMPAQNAFIGDLAGVGSVQKAFVLNAMVIQISRMIGPSVAGWLISGLGVSSAFWLNGLSFVAVIASLLRVQATQVRQARTGHPLQEFAAGVRYMNQSPRIQDLMVLTGYIYLFGFANTQIIPAIATDYLHGGAATLGLLMGAFGAGALVSSVLVVPLVQQFRRTGLVLAGAVVWAGVWFGLFSLSTWLPLSLISMFFAAFGQPVVLATSKALLQLLSPSTMWARMLGLQIMVTNGLQPFASLAIGFVAQGIGAPVAVRINAGLMLLGSALLLALRPALRRWEAQREPRAV